MTIYSINNLPQRFYVYLYLREDTTPYYVGKGHGIRAWTKGRGEIGKPTTSDRIYILTDNLTESEAFALEIITIALYGRKDISTGILRNKTDGGEGAAGYRFSPEQCVARGPAISKAKKGVPLTEEHRRSLSIAHTGKPSPKKGVKQSLAEVEAKKLVLKGLVYPIVMCPNCNKMGAGPVMRRYHFDKCGNNTRILSYAK